MDRRLYEASLSGSVADLENLEGEDPLILDRVSLTCFDQTPLHIAAWRGHSDFTRALLSRKPRLASELNSARCSPLHLASAEGHHEIVQHLLDVNDDVCEVHDEDGRTPLHLAAMKGRVEVIEMLTRARPESIRQKLGRGGETVLHMCVKYNRLEALKTLVDEFQNDAGFVNSEDQDGNTILHLAAALKQLDTIKYLLKLTSVKEQAKTENKNGFTALDIVELSPIKDLKTMEIQQFLVEAGVPSFRRAPNIKEEIRTSSSSANHQPENLFIRLWEKMSSFWNKYFKPERGWFKEVRVHFITASTLTTTMAYQAGLSPPGSVWQDFPNTNLNVTSNDIGTSIFARTQDHDFMCFLFFNTASFIASMFTLILASSGFPPENKFFTVLMMVLMFFSLTCMTFSYLWTMNMISPHDALVCVEKIIHWALKFWFGICIAGGLFQVLRGCPWLWRKLRIRGLCSWLCHKLVILIQFLTTIMLGLWHKKLGEPCNNPNNGNP
ncbi:ankyrin repeat-containing protein ITN1-like isoform X1 [Camellia sinensis]|uniref:ankyrin repeat-containing protein ITN1-like isoform X1 n=1 Tax=Camellia sinensis TaxID=4442 RepID=UPI00103593A1|nr:ankyrin repeat-containing protein ITN1-like isoform X1 [Camellia sinensis]